jgi:hypothetical protein
VKVGLAEPFGQFPVRPLGAFIAFLITKPLIFSLKYLRSSSVYRSR